MRAGVLGVRYSKRESGTCQVIDCLFARGAAREPGYEARYAACLGVIRFRNILAVFLSCLLKKCAWPSYPPTKIVNLIVSRYELTAGSQFLVTALPERAASGVTLLCHGDCDTRIAELSAQARLGVAAGPPQPC